MKKEILELATRYRFDLEPAASADMIDQAKDALQLPQVICDFYAVCNGLQHGWFRVPPLFNPDRVKLTWDSIQRANDPQKSKYLRGQNDFLKDFLVCATLSGADYAVLKRADNTIWFSMGNELNQTDLTFIELIATCLREVDEL